MVCTPAAGQRAVRPRGELRRCGRQRDDVACPRPPPFGLEQTFRGEMTSPAGGTSSSMTSSPVRPTIARPTPSTIPFRWEDAAGKENRHSAPVASPRCRSCRKEKAAQEPPGDPATLYERIVHMSWRFHMTSRIGRAPPTQLSGIYQRRTGAKWATMGQPAEPRRAEGAPRGGGAAVGAAGRGRRARSGGQSTSAVTSSVDAAACGTAAPGAIRGGRGCGRSRVDRRSSPPGAAARRSPGTPARRGRRSGAAARPRRRGAGERCRPAAARAGRSPGRPANSRGRRTRRGNHIAFDATAAIETVPRDNQSASRLHVARTR